MKNTTIRLLASFWNFLPRVLVFIFISSLVQGALAEDERLWVDATINNKPARMIFDTGAGQLILFSNGAKRLGLSFTNAPKEARPRPGEVAMGETEECNLEVGKGRVKTHFQVFELPGALSVTADGVLGWSPCRDNIFAIDACDRKVTTLSSLPDIATNWAAFKLWTNAHEVLLELPGPRGDLSTVLVDTGDDGGVRLSPDRWRAWKAANRGQPLTLEAYYTPYDGLVVAQDAWARELAIGSFLITDVPVSEANKGQIALGTGKDQMVLGLAALKRLDFIIDGKRGLAYLHAKATPPPAYEHNRLGAVFVPLNYESDDLIAHVIEGSPAWKAGIRDGDVLIRIGDLDVTRWRVNPEVLPLSRFFVRPAGTSLDLTLKRGKVVMKANALLEQILSSK